MLNITNHYSSANQNYNEGAPHTIYNGHHQKLKRKPAEGEKILQIIYLIRDLYSEYIKNSYNSTMRRQITQLKNGQRI